MNEEGGISEEVEGEEDAEAVIEEGVSPEGVVAAQEEQAVIDEGENAGELEGEKESPVTKRKRLRHISRESDGQRRIGEPEMERNHFID